MNEEMKQYAKEFASKGGKAVAKKYGIKHYQEMQKKSAEARRRNKLTKK